MELYDLMLKKSPHWKEFVRPMRQEDWQDKYFSSLERKGDLIHTPVDFPEWIKNELDYLRPIFELGLKFSEQMTILWCLFVHKEVYGLEWDWEKNEWRKA